MIPYAQTEVFTPLELQTYEAAKELVTRIPNGLESDSVRCHEVARIVAGVFPDALEWRDGEYSRGLAHAWCVFRNQVPVYNGHTRREIILDPYASHSLPQVQLANVGYMVQEIYIEGCLLGDPVDDEWVSEVVESLRPKMSCTCTATIDWPSRRIPNALKNLDCPRHGI